MDRLVIVAHAAGISGHPGEGLIIQCPSGNSLSPITPTLTLPRRGGGENRVSGWKLSNPVPGRAPFRMGIGIPVDFPPQG